MRLKDLTGFELRPASPYEPHDTQPEQSRLVAYTAGQTRPVYISEEFAPSTSVSTYLNPVSFTDFPLGRNFRMAVQLWARANPMQSSSLEDLAKSTQQEKDEPWHIVSEWIIDLRQIRPVAHKKTRSRLVILTESGPMAVSTSIVDDSVQGSPLLGNDSADGATGPNGFARHASAHGSAGASANGSVNDSLNGVDERGDSLVNRWFSWGRGTLNGSNTRSSTEPAKLTSLSFPKLVDLWTLQHSLDEARVSAVSIGGELDTLLPSASLPLRERKAVLEKRITRIQKFAQRVRAETQVLREDEEANRTYQKSLKSKLHESLDAMAQAHVHSEKELESMRKPSDKDSRIRKEQGRLATALLSIFPIDLTGDGTFHFTINGLLLPSVFAINHYDTTQIGAALGFVAQVLVYLSRYLDTALPYPITVFGSQSYITDNISRIKHGSNKFPLWTRGALLYRVEYGLYLLHKDIEHLMNALCLPVSDLKQTLANLKNVLLVLSSEYTKSNA